MPQAQELASEIGRGLDNLQSAIDRACRHHQNRPLVISCEPTFLIRWLIPRLAGLQQAVGKERDLQLVSAGGAVAFSREGIDLAIRRNDFPIADDVVARPFLKERVGPVAAGSMPRRGVNCAAPCSTPRRARTPGATGVPTAASRSGRATSCVSNISISACRRRSPAPVSASARWRWWRMISSTARWWRHMALRLTGRIMC